MRSLGTTLIALSALCLVQVIVGHREPEAGEQAEHGHGWVEGTLSVLTLEEKVGQMLQLRYYADYASFDDKSYLHLRDEVQKYHVGSIVFGMHFNNSGPLRSSPLDAAKTANQLQNDSKLPLLLAADLERSVASRLSGVPSFPWPMALGAANSTGDVQEFGAITAREARAIGVHWALAPVADINSNPANPVINDRSFGENPDMVGALVAAFIRGAHQNGLLVTAKHFPGNGNASIDSHHAVATMDMDLEHLRTVEFVPFKFAIDAGVDSILLAHAKVPALEPDQERITTVSSRVVEETLKSELGFKGVVLTDALEMRGITKLYDPAKGSPTAQAAVDAVKAGCDVIMLPTDVDGAFRSILGAVRSREIPESRIDESVRKILQMKTAVGLDKNRFVDLGRVTELVSKPEDMVFAQRVADKAITLVRNNGDVLPLRKRTPSEKEELQGSEITVSHKLIGIVLAEVLEAGNGREFERELLARRPDAHVYYVDRRTANAGGIQVLESIKKANEVVVAAYVVHGSARQTIVGGKTLTFYGIAGPSGQLLKKILGQAPEKTVVVALGSPYLIADFPEIQNYACTYAMATTSEISAVKALFGETQNHAKLPVTLPGIAPLGFSLPWPTRSRTTGSD